MIKFEEVTKSFQDDFWKKPKVVVDKLSFEVSEGALCGFLGANGAGKTTSIKAALNFISIDSGKISYDQRMGSSFNEIRSKVGYFPEGPYFYPHMTGRDFCLYLGQLQSIPKHLVKERMESWGERLGIAFAFDRKVRGYSKGMLQRLGFLSTLIHDPKFIILDEPLSGLDPLGRKEFKDILVSLNNKGTTIFFSSHIVSDVEEICDSLVVIRSGKLFYSGKTEHLLNSQTSKDYRVAFKGTNKTEALGKIFTSIQERDGFFLGTVQKEHKESFLKEITNGDFDLLEFGVERLTLEEIIYNSKTDGGSH